MKTNPHNSPLLLAIGSWFLVLFTVAVIGLFCTLCVQQRETIRTLYIEFGLVLPRIVEYLLLIPSSVIVGGSALTSILLLLKEWWMRDKTATLAINAAALSCLIVLYNLHREILFMPLQTMMQGLQ